MRVLQRGERNVVCRFIIEGEDFDPDAAAAELGSIGLSIDEIWYRGQLSRKNSGIAFLSELNQDDSAVDHVVHILETIAPFHANLTRGSANSQRNIVLTFLVPDADKEHNTSLVLPANVVQLLNGIAAGLKVEVSSYKRSSLGIRLSQSAPGGVSDLRVGPLK